MGIVPIPAIIFGVLFLIYSQYMSRRSGGNVNHDAHFIGAVFGFIYPIMLKPNLIHYFISQVF
jgi:membrane associated rhomboid family serine protease